MKKTLFLTVSLVAFIMMQSYAWSASSMTPYKFNLGTISENYSWAPEQPIDDYSLTFTVENNTGVDFQMTMQKSQIIWFFDGKEKKWNVSDKDSSSWLWTKHFDKGSYTLDVYGKTVNAFRVLGAGEGSPVPLPSALIFLVSGIVGLFSVRRFKQPIA